MLQNLCINQSDNLLELREGYPENFNGQIIRGSQAIFGESEFGEIIIQKICSELVTFTKIVINWRRPARLIFSYKGQPSIFVRAVLGSNLHEFIKGAGELHLKKRQFAALTGSSWRSGIMAEGPGLQVLVDVSCSVDYISAYLQRQRSLVEKIRNGIAGLPERYPAPPLSTDEHYSGSIEALLTADGNANNKFHQAVKKYMEPTLDELQHQRSVRRQMKEADWHLIQGIRQVLETNPSEHYTIPEISRKAGINEQKLKSLFPKITGFGIDEYRKYLLCTRAARKMIQQRDEPLKSFYVEAGYSNLPNFLRGFRKLCCCSPGELRQDGWEHEKIRKEIEFSTKSDENEQ